MTQFHKKLARPLLTRKKWAVLGGAMEQKTRLHCRRGHLVFFPLVHGWAGPKGKFRNRMGMNGPVQKKGGQMHKGKSRGAAAERAI